MSAAPVVNMWCRGMACKYKSDHDDDDDDDDDHTLLGPS